jgi:Phage integrase family.
MPKYYRDKTAFEVVKKEEIEPYILNAQNEEMRIVLALAWLTGARISEILELKKQDF